MSLLERIDAPYGDEEIEQGKRLIKVGDDRNIPFSDWLAYRINRLGWKDDSAQRPPLWCGHNRRHLRKRSRFQPYAEGKWRARWRMAFQGPLFFQGPTGRGFSLWRAALRCVRENVPSSTEFHSCS